MPFYTEIGLTLCKQHHRGSAGLVVHKAETKLSMLFFLIVVQPAKGAGTWTVIIQTHWLVLYLCKKKLVLGWQDAWLLPWKAESFRGYLRVRVAAAALLRLSLVWHQGECPGQQEDVWLCRAWLCWSVCAVCAARLPGVLCQPQLLAPLMKFLVIW